MKAVEACYEVYQHYAEHGTVEHFKKKSKAEKKASKAAKKEVRQEKMAGFKNKVGAVVEKIGTIGVLSPFRKLMVNQLSAIGIPTDDKTELAEIASLFYDNVVRKKKNYEVENFVISAAMLGGIVSGILSFFKGLKKKKDAGETMTPAEDKMLATAKMVGEKADALEQDYTEETIGEYAMKILPWAIGGLILFLILRK